MYPRNPSNKTFSNHSLQNWQSKKCDFCMYHGIIFDQLQKVKQAILIKNQRIVQLEQFIKRISQMAFINLPQSKGINTESIGVLQKRIQLKSEAQNEPVFRIQKIRNKQFFQKKSQDPIQISFRDCKQNLPTFNGKRKDQSLERDNQYQKINELNQLKKELQRKIYGSVNQQDYQDSESNLNLNNTNQYDTFKTLSEPQQQGQVGQIRQIYDQNSRKAELSQRTSKFSDTDKPSHDQNQLLVRNSSQKGGISQGMSSIQIIKQYIRKLK